jgi:hypothetical protein
MRLPITPMLLATLLASPVAAQRAFGVGVGGAYRAERDDLASPLRYAGLGPALRLTYSADGTRSRFAIALDAGTAHLTSAASTPSMHYARDTRGSLGVEYLRRVHGGRLSLFVGGRFDASADVRQHTYDPATVGSELFVDVFGVVEAAGAATLPLGPGTISTTLAVPLISLAFRTPYTGAKYVPSPELRAPGTLLGFDNWLAYRWWPTRGVGFEAFHTFQWIHYPTPRPLAAVVQRFGVSLMFAVGRTR